MEVRDYERLDRTISSGGGDDAVGAGDNIATAVNAPPDETLVMATPAAASSGRSAPTPPRDVANYARILLLAAGLFLAYKLLQQLASVLLLFASAFIVAVVLNAPVRLLEKRGVKRGLSAAGVALIVLAGMGTAGYLAGPPLAEQATRLAQGAPEGMERVRARIDQYTDRYPALRNVVRSENFNNANAAKEIQRFLPRLGRFTMGLLGALTGAFFLLVTALYTLGAPKALVRGAISAVPPGYRRPAARSLTRIVGQLESWALATLTLMVIVGVLSGVGLWLLGIPNAALFGVIAGIGEGIPSIGPILSAVPPTIVAFASEPNKALWVVLLFLAIQQIENNVLVPIIMGRSLKLHPVSILFFVLALGALIGIAGALLAVPTAIVTKVLYEEFYLRPRRPHADALDRAADQVIRAGTRPPRRAAAARRSGNVTIFGRR